MAENLSLVAQLIIDRTKALVAIQELHCDDGSGNCEECFFPGKEGDWQSVKHPCATRRLADDALATRTTKNGDNK